MQRMQLLAGLMWGLTLWCVTGCTNQPLDPAGLSSHALADVPDHQLCMAYSRNRAPNIQAELKRRGTFTELEWQAIEGRQVILGIGEMALMTALPGITCTDIRRSNGMVTKEWHYARVTATRIRTENGKVAWFK